MAKINMEEIEAAKRISGPYSLFDNSFILEFLEPPDSLDATVLMRSKYVGSSQKLQKNHPQSPPLHLHFDQFESFFVGSGKVGTTDGYAAKDNIWTRADGVQVIKPWEPHRFWPVPEAEAEGDSTLYVWAHPTGVLEPMDRCFFENLLKYISDASEKKVSLSLMQVMAMQHATASALIMFPTAWWLGPLRWWVPWKFQSACAWIGGMFGYQPLMEQYTSKEDFEAYFRMKKR